MTCFICRYHGKCFFDNVSPLPEPDKIVGFGALKVRLTPMGADPVFQQKVRTPPLCSLSTVDSRLMQARRYFSEVQELSCI